MSFIAGVFLFVVVVGLVDRRLPLAVRETSGGLPSDRWSLWFCRNG